MSGFEIPHVIHNPESPRQEYAIVPRWAIERLQKNDDPLAWSVYCRLSGRLNNPGGIAKVTLSEIARESGIDHKFMPRIIHDLANIGVVVTTKEGWHLPWTQ